MQTVNMEHTVPAESQKEWSSRLACWLAQLSVADGIYLLILAAAAIMRLFELDKLPLSPDEARAAWSAWRAVQPGYELLEIPSPAYFSITLLPGQLLGFSDSVARLVPAVVGLGIVMIPWLLRETLGSKGAIVMALLLAISPLNSVAARTAGGDSLTIFAVLLMAAGWLRHRGVGDSRWLYVLFLSFGLGLSSSPLFYGALVTLLFANLAQSAFASPVKTMRLGFSTLIADRRPLLLGASTFLATSTLLLLYPGGLEAASRLPVEWITRFSLGGGLSQLLNPLLALGRYEVLLLVPGVAAVVWAWKENNRLGKFCVYWLASILALTVFQPGYMQNALLALVPGYLLLALFIDDVLNQGMDRVSWTTALAVLLSCCLILVNVARYSRAAIYDPQDLSHLWMAIMVAAIAMAVIYFVGSWSPGAAMQGVLVGWTLVSFFYLWGTAWWLGHAASNDPRVLWVDTGTDDDIGMLVDVVNHLSQQATGSSSMLDIFSTVDSYVLRWYLRGYADLSIGATMPPGSDPTVIISSSDAPVTPDQDYLGADFGLYQSRTGQLPAESRGRFLDTLRWWMFHESSTVIRHEKLVLWWKSSLIQEN